MLEQFVELQKQLAEVVVWLRSDGYPCPYHSWVYVRLMYDPGGATEPNETTQVPVCQADGDIDCDWRDRRQELLDSCLSVLGTEDMSGWLP